MSQAAFFLSIIFFLGRCSVRGIVFSKTTCCWHLINVSHIRCGSQQKAEPGWFSINPEGLYHRLSANQYSTAVVCQQPGILHGREPASFLGHVHTWLQCLVPSGRRRRAMGLRDGACGRVGVSASVGRCHRRVLPMRKPPQGKGEVCLLQPKLCTGQTRVVLLPGDGLGQSQGGRDALLLPGVFSTWACTPHLPLLLLSACHPAAFLHPPGPADVQTTAGRKALEMGVSRAAL